MKDCKWSIEFVCDCDKKNESLCGQKQCPVFKYFSCHDTLVFLKKLNVKNYSLRFRGEKDE